MKHIFLAVLVLWTVAIRAQRVIISTLQNLYSLDPEHCTSKFIVTTDREMYDISFHPNGVLYGIRGAQLFEIDTLTGITTLIHSFPLTALEGLNGNALAVSADGIIYALGDIVRLDPLEIVYGTLWSYDIDQDISVYHGSTGYSSAGDIIFYNGNLFSAATDDRIVKININNPSESTLEFETEIFGEILGLVSYNSKCLQQDLFLLTENGNVYLINFDDEIVDVVCNTNLSITGGASTSEFYEYNPIILDTVLVQAANCDGLNGILTVLASGGQGLLMYSLDDSNYQLDRTFAGLHTGMITLYIEDARGCEIQAEINIPEVASSITINAEIADASCGTNNGRLTVLTNEGYNGLAFALNDGPYGPDNIFERLGPGYYVIRVKEPNGCVTNLPVTIETAACPLYIPNVFSPNGDGINDLFGPIVQPGFNGAIKRLTIMDRWGDVLFEAHYLITDSTNRQWNGLSSGEPVAPGVYVYVIEIQYQNNSSEFFWGDVTLVR